MKSKLPSHSGREFLLERSFLVALSLGALLFSACVDTSSDPQGAAGAGGQVDQAGGGGGTDNGEVIRPELACGKLAQLDGPVVLGYLPTWIGDFDGQVESLDYQTLTHVALAFALPSGEGKLGFEVPDESVKRLVELAHENGVKVLVSIGGASHSHEIQSLIVAEKLNGFVDHVEELLTEYGFDGVDVDIEGGAVDENYEPLVLALAEKIRPQGKLLSSAIGAWFAGQVTDRALFCFDFVNVMSYDYAGTWSDAADHSTYASAQKDLTYYASTRDYPRSRVVLGIPFYGYCWGSACERAYTPFAEIAQTYPDKTGQDWISESGAQISFNGTKTIERKALLGKTYGGVMIWELTQDDESKSLMSALKRGLEQEP